MRLEELLVLPLNDPLQLFIRALVEFDLVVGVREDVNAQYLFGPVFVGDTLFASDLVLFIDAAQGVHEANSDLEAIRFREGRILVKVVVDQGLAERAVAVHGPVIHLVKEEDHDEEEDDQAEAGSDGRPVGGLPIGEVELGWLAEGVVAQHALRMQAVRFVPVRFLVPGLLAL